MQENTHLSKIKFKVTLIAVCAIVFVLALLVISVVEIHTFHSLSSQIEQQDEDLSSLQKEKDYYNSANYKDNSARDETGNYGNDGDLIFTEE